MLGNSEGAGDWQCGKVRGKRWVHKTSPRSGHATTQTHDALRVPYNSPGAVKLAGLLHITLTTCSLATGLAD